MKKVNFLFVFGIFTAFFLSLAQPVKAAETDDRKAMDILQNMARTIAGAKQFSVTVSSSFDALQANGQMVEFGAVREIQVKRPDKLRVDLQHSDGDQRVLVFDGKQIIVQDVTENVYAKVENPGSVDDAIKHLVGDLKIPLPLARMFRTNFPTELDRLVEEVDYVEQNVLTDVPTDHLAARSKDVDFQIWVTRGKEPLPRRVVITYKNAKGEPQYRADFSDWNLSTKPPKGAFIFTPPGNAEQVPLLVRNRTEAGTPSREGGAQ